VEADLLLTICKKYQVESGGFPQRLDRSFITLFLVSASVALQEARQ
jgi:hypothetical protein